jgi:glycosyltransferase involved in cell wall biosynthesis
MSKLSAHCNIKNPKSWGYPYLESIQSFIDLCDEVVIVNGATPANDDGSIEEIKKLKGAEKIKIIDFEWPDNWLWDQIAISLQKGYENCTGDWVFKFDVDHVFPPEKKFYLREIIEKCEKMRVPPKAIGVRKCNFVLADRYFDKYRSPLIVNKKDYPNLCYGINYETADFMCALDKVEEKNGVAMGWSISEQKELIKNCNVEVFCYDFTFMTKEIIEKNRKMFDIALYCYEDPMMSERRIKICQNDALEKFARMMTARIENNEFMYFEKISDHPRYIQERLNNLTKDMFGYNLFGWTPLHCKYETKSREPQQTN